MAMLMDPLVNATLGKIGSMISVAIFRIIQV